MYLMSNLTPFDTLRPVSDEDALAGNLPMGWSQVLRVRTNPPIGSGVRDFQNGAPPNLVSLHRLRTLKIARQFIDG